MPVPELGLVSPIATSHGLGVTQFDRSEEARFPACEEIAGVVSFGGQMSARTANRNEFLAHELAFLRAMLAADSPVLGLCLGAQLLSIAAGGDVYELERPHIAVERLEPFPAARHDVVARVLPASVPVIEWHCDGIVTPPNAEVLAETPGPGCSMFRVGTSAWGSQLHFEATLDLVLAWTRDPVEEHSFAAAGVSPQAFAAQAQIAVPTQMAIGQQLIDRFIGMVVEREQARVTPVDACPAQRAAVLDRDDVSA